METGAGAGATDTTVERVVEDETRSLAGWKNCAGTVAFFVVLALEVELEVVSGAADGATKPSETHCDTN